MSSCKDPSQPFPSPGSAFIPPPVPGAHEFALRRSSLARKMSKKDIDDAAADMSRFTVCNGTTTNGVAQSSSTHTSPNGVVSHIDTRVPAPLSFLRSFVPLFVLSILNIPRSIWRVLQFQDPPSHQPARDPPDPHSHPSASDPQLPLPLGSHQRLSTQSVTSLTSSRPAPPSPAVSRRTSGLSRTSSRPVSGMNSAASSRPVSGVHHSRPISGAGAAQSDMMTATTPIATTPTLPRHPHDRRPNLASASDLEPTPAEPTPTLTQAAVLPTTTPALIQIRDYGFAPTDSRFSGQGPHVPRANRPAVLARRLDSSSKSTPTSPSEGDNGNDDNDDDYEDIDEEGEGERMSVDVVQRMWEEVVDDGTSGWGGFKWGFGPAWGFGKVANGMGPTPSGAGFPSRGDLDRNFGGEDEYECEDMEIEEEREAISDDEGEGDMDMDADVEPALFPGLYRALYTFEPEGTAEMKLEEDQVVRVIGRGGGVGWAVVVKDGLKDTGVHALVPESYLEPVRLDGEEYA
ncbi:hypothetical protein OG21DRAFT_750859 [Imleria badia]|nr:hypothetical protein OG21DRAFT_750859 [Imleria badia]